MGPTRPMEEQSGWAEHADFMDGLVGDGFIFPCHPDIDVVDDRKLTPMGQAGANPAVQLVCQADTISQAGQKRNISIGRPYQPFGLQNPVRLLEQSRARQLLPPSGQEFQEAFNISSWFAAEI
jgi:hypothetical protein